jgi:hypothetical protein
MMGIVVTRFTKIGGPLTKEISISNGALKSDGSKCVMGRGRAQRVRLDNLTQLGELMTGVTSNQALGLGRLRDDLPDCVRIMTKTAAAKLNGSLPPNTITRTAEAIDYTPGEAAVALIDFDQKGMPADVRARVASAGGCEGVLTTIVPELATGGRVVRTSTSAGIYRTDTGATMPGSGGLHILPLVQDGSDIERFLRTLHERCWAAGCGWYIVGAAGQLLERSLVDKMVYAPERLVFEGPPILIAPLAQDQAARQPRVFDGPPLERRVCRCGFPNSRRSQSSKPKRRMF